MMLQGAPVSPYNFETITTSDALAIVFGTVGVLFLAHWAWSSRASFKSILQWWRDRR